MSPSKKPRIQLYADECFPVTSSMHLKSKGVSIVHANDRNYTGKDDRFHLKISKKMNRVLITADRDFLYYDTASLKGYPGVIIVTGTATPKNINKICDKALTKLTSNSASEALIRISKSKIIKLKNDRKQESRV